MIISKLDFLSHTNIDEETLDIWVAEEWLMPNQDPEQPQFTDADVARAKLINDLIHDLGVNQQGIGIILELLDQMHSLRKAMAERLRRTT